ncbi:hypothetical protein K493DRAFT_310924 [Basidiobolus meristosporus CBS 931.73]|uniref:Uncharacterized protein n=1 Tax=Basidiobolus meristosporus CBS 931.73 TaxID=1314790 RepID=A0A1Y1Z5D6_9FUNG|nr:hypothetical protein K493DRAFT_310924 [Basidiobolus meristosporus CBS 931.73]|eukprot:ORY05512.1 hypothetical protein K493DRAFT_310924 [Basidiobolus meristosporus CBS 931.73]
MKNINSIEEIISQLDSNTVIEKSPLDILQSRIQNQISQAPSSDSLPAHQQPNSADLPQKLVSFSNNYETPILDVKWF